MPAEAEVSKETSCLPTSCLPSSAFFFSRNHECLKDLRRRWRLAARGGRIRPDSAEGGRPMPTLRLAALAAVALLAALPARAAESGIERLYVLDCGENHGKDQARW